MHAEVHLDRIRPGRRRAAKRRHDRRQLKAWLDRPIERRNAGLIFGAGVLGGSILGRQRHSHPNGTGEKAPEATSDEPAAAPSQPAPVASGAARPESQEEMTAAYEEGHVPSDS